MAILQLAKGFLKLTVYVAFTARYPGFNTLKVRARGGMPVAFADFEVLLSAS